MNARQLTACCTLVLLSACSSWSVYTKNKWADVPESTTPARIMRADDVDRAALAEAFGEELLPLGMLQTTDISDERLASLAAEHGADLAIVSEDTHEMEVLEGTYTYVPNPYYGSYLDSAGNPKGTPNYDPGEYRMTGMEYRTREDVEHLNVWLYVDGRRLSPEARERLELRKEAMGW